MAELSYHLEWLLDDIDARCLSWDGGADRSLTGMRQLDALTGGLGPGGWLVQGPPGSGTTALLLQLVRSIAAVPGQSVRLVTVELSPYEVVSRLVAGAGRLSLEVVRSGHPMPDEWGRLSLVMKSLGRARVEVVDGRDWSMADFEAWCEEERPRLDARGSTWLAVDGLDRLYMSGLINLRRLERISGRSVLASVHSCRHDGGTGVALTLDVDDAGRRTLAVRHERSDRAVIGVAVHPEHLGVRELERPPELRGQLRLPVDG